MASPETIIVAEILAEFGALPDLRLWRNETAGAWVGKVVGRTKAGDLVLRGARMIQAGLCVGSPDLIGLQLGGRFLGIEVKTPRGRAAEAQKQWIKVVGDLGGLTGIVTSPEDVAKLLRQGPSLL